MKKIPIVFIALSLMVAAPARAQLGETGGALPDLPTNAVQVVIGPAQKEPDPIAIPDPSCEGPGELCAMVAEVLRNDMMLSGFFNILKPKTFIADLKGEPLEAPKYADWFNVGAKYLIKTEVSSAGGGVDLKFRFFNVFDKTMVSVTPSTFNGIGRGDVRAKTHEFANALIFALTGTQGVFGTKITYAAKTGDWSKSIFVMEMDGHDAGAVISNKRINMFPSFAGGGVIYTSLAEGEDPQIFIGDKQLTQGNGKFRRADVGPNGQIAVSVDVGGGSDIWLMDKGGKLVKNLTGGNGDSLSPSWSPDGSQIAFVSNRGGGPQVYVMNADGSGQRRLTMAGAYNTTPDFGPDGLIVFAGMDDATSDIFTVDLSGNIRRLTQDQGFNKDPTWSPDGRYVAFVSSRDGGRIFIMTADGRYQFPVSQRPCGCATPSWAD
jgi:TolB protein